MEETGLLQINQKDFCGVKKTPPKQDRKRQAEGGVERDIAKRISIKEKG